MLASSQLDSDVITVYVNISSFFLIKLTTSNLPPTQNGIMDTSMHLSACACVPTVPTCSQGSNTFHLWVVLELSVKKYITNNICFMTHSHKWSTRDPLHLHSLNTFIDSHIHSFTFVSTIHTQEPLLRPKSQIPKGPERLLWTLFP